MISHFPVQLKGNAQTLWMNKVFAIDNSGKLLDEERKQFFHMYVVKAILLCKRGRPEIVIGVAILIT